MFKKRTLTYRMGIGTIKRTGGDGVKEEKKWEKLNLETNSNLQNLRPSYQNYGFHSKLITVIQRILTGQTPCHVHAISLSFMMIWQTPAVWSNALACF